MSDARVLNGKEIAAEMRLSLRDRVEKLPRAPILGIVLAEGNPVIDSFVKIKKKTAEEIGVQVKEVRVREGAEPQKYDDVLQKLREECDGVVLQLPIPPGITVETLARKIPVLKDVDALSMEAKAKQFVLAPVTAAIVHIVEEESIDVFQKKVLIVGRGQLVGQPTAEWFKKQHADVVVVGRDTTPEELKDLTFQADIIVSGAGSPHLITPDMIRSGVVLFDAGTSSSEGSVVGDIDPECVSKASLAVLVPGGIGPIMVACLFQNLLTLMKMA